MSQRSGGPKIRKRDGRIVRFRAEKIEDAIFKAMTANRKPDRELAERITSMIVLKVARRFKGKIPSVEDVQDIVEETLMENGQASVAKAYILYRQKRAAIRETKGFIGVPKDELKLNVNAIEVLKSRYLLRDEFGQTIETPKQMFMRVAKTIAEVDKKYGSPATAKKSMKEFLNLMAGLYFLPNSPTLMNAGTELGQLSACFVIPVGDSMEEIFDAVKYMALIHKSGGGCCAEGTIIPTVEYGFVPIEKIPQFETIPIDEQAHSCRQKLHVFAFDKRTETFTIAPVSHLWKFRRRDALKIEFGSTGSVVVTPWHPFFIYEPSEDPNKGGEYAVRHADELAVGDWLVKPSFADRLFANEEPSFWWLYGFFLGDGSIDTGKNGVRLRFFSKDPRMVERIQDTLEYCTNSRGSIFEDSRNGVRTVTITSHLSDHGTANLQANQFFERIIKLNRDSIKKKHPPKPSFLCLNPYAFIAGLIDSDGWVGKDKGGISTGKKELADIVSRHLAMIGVNSTTRYRKDPRNRQIRGNIWQIDFPNGFIKWLPTVKRARRNIWVDSKKIQITRITKAEEEQVFYDFTVPKYQNYLGGKSQFVSIHNTGFSFSSLRPKGDLVKSTKGVASGPVSFMRVFDVATDIIKQGGKRRGANMGMLSVDHPDIIDFITVKSKGETLTNFNISVAVTDSFMEAVEEDGKYDLVNPRTGHLVRKASAREVFNLIVTSAWSSGDPGLVFIDEINRANPTPKIGRIDSTNPCGEQPLLSYESCNLGSINLLKMVDEGKIDWSRLRHVTREGVHFLDNVIDANNFPLKETETITKANRKIGLGVMGFADALLKLGVPFDSSEALNVAEEIMKFIAKEARQKSVELGEERGSFPNFKESIWYEEEGYNHMRNATQTTIAPTGTISIIAEASSGIEPLFAISFLRNILDGTHLLETNKIFEDVAKKEGFHSQEMIREVAKKGSLHGIEGIPDNVKRLFVTAQDIAPEWHVRVQAAFQKYVDNAVSKTVNLPHDATIDEVRKIFMFAYRERCKGITVYRYGCREEQVLYIGGEGNRILQKPRYVVASSEFSGGCPTGRCLF